MDCRKRIVIVNENQMFCGKMKGILERDYDAEVVGIAHDGNQAIQMVREKKPDLLLLDLLLPQYDGITVLDEIADVTAEAEIFVTTGFVSDYVLNALGKRNVSCLFMSPCCPETIARRLFTAGKYALQFSGEKQNLKSIIADILHELGMPANLKGYHYLQDAIALAVEDLDRVNAMMNCIYIPIAQKRNTTADRVRKNITRAIEIAWDRGDVEILQRHFGYTISGARGKATNSEFIALIADKLQLQLLSQNANNK